MNYEDFLKSVRMNRYEYLGSDADLPCFANRIRVNRYFNTPAIIKEAIKQACALVKVDVIVFSVTERDECWKVWEQYAKDHPRTFKIVQGGSIHGNYQCRMYIYTKPKSKRRWKV